MMFVFQLFGRISPHFLILAIVFNSGCVGLSGGTIDGLYADANARYYADLHNGSIVYMEPAAPGYHQFFRGHYLVNGNCITVTLTQKLDAENVFRTMDETGRILTRIDAYHLETPDGTRLNRLRRVSINTSLQHHE